jgi:monoamine oxidase
VFKTVFLSLMMALPLFAHSPKIVVVGAGYSGLTTAYELTKRGFRVEVVEARNRVGGRVLTVNVKGHLAELGGQNLLDGGDSRHLLALIDELGLELETRESTMHYRYYSEGQIFDANQLCLQDQTLLRAKLDTLRQTAHNMEEVLKELFDEDDICYKICDALLAGYEGAPIHKLSPYYVETLYHILSGGLSSAHHGQTISYGVIQGGNHLLAEALAKKFPVHLNHPLIAIDKNRDGTYLLTFQDGNTVAADIVVLTMPCPVYNDISISHAAMPPATKKAIASIENGTTAKIAVPISPEKGHDGGIGTARATTFLNRDAYVINVYFYNEHGHFTPETLHHVYQQELPQLQKFYDTDPTVQPVYAKDELLASYDTAVGYSWPSDPFAKGSYSYIGAGQEEIFTSITDMLDEPVKTLFAPIDNRLFFAGEHTSILLDVGGTMEAAVESGVRCARLIEKIVACENCQ